MPLFYGCLARISTHLSNTLNSVVMTVDRLDFYRQAKAVVEPDEGPRRTSSAEGPAMGPSVAFRL